MFKKLLAIVTAVSIAVGTCAFSAFAEATPAAATSGNCGEKATWSFDESTGILTISGTGDMYTNYTPVDQWEYYPLRESVKEVVVENGITSIATCAFGRIEYREPSAYPNLTKLTLPSSVKVIGNYAFYKSGLTSIKFSEGLETIGEKAFSDSSLSGDLVLPKTLKTIGQIAFSNTGITSVNLYEGMTLGGQAFSGCNSLEEVTIPQDLYYLGINTANMVRANAAFFDCKNLEKVVILGGGIVHINLSGGEYPDNGLAQDMFMGCTSLKEVVIKSDNISYVDSGTFDMTSNPVFYIYKDSTTEKTLIDAGYLTDENVVYIVNKSALEETVKSAEDMDTSLYTSESVDNLNKAIEAGKAVIADEDAKQEDVDNVVKAIKDALDGLKYPPADYTAVDEAIAKIPADLSIYTDETAKAVTAAVEAVDRTKDITEQEIVDGYAKAIEDAIAGLELMPKGSISGTVTAPGVDAEVKVTVTNAGSEVVAEVTAENGKYTVSDLESGEYVITVTAENCVLRSYEVTVADGDVTLDAEIHLKGDINGDGKITTTDVGLSNAHAKGIKALEGYDTEVADISKDGKVTTADVGAINSHAQGVRALW